jgi:hypothetical protein
MRVSCSTSFRSRARGLRPDTGRRGQVAQPRRRRPGLRGPVRNLV